MGSWLHGQISSGSRRKARAGAHPGVRSSDRSLTLPLLGIVGVDADQAIHVRPTAASTTGPTNSASPPRQSRS
jgi:hypothetical protein